MPHRFSRKLCDRLISTPIINNVGVEANWSSHDMKHSLIARCRLMRRRVRRRWPHAILIALFAAGLVSFLSWAGYGGSFRRTGIVSRRGFNGALHEFVVVAVFMFVVAVLCPFRTGPYDDI